MNSEKELAARLDEDERIARAVTPDDWGDEDTSAHYEWEDLPDAAFTHAKRHNPARALRFVAAVRAILTEDETGGGNSWSPDYYAGLGFALDRLAEVYDES